MAGVVFSTMEAAINAAYELRDELDSDVYVVRRRYPSGEEFFLSQFERDDCIYIARIRPDHIFNPTKAGKKQAFEYAKIFDMYVKQNKQEVNGYIYTKSYTLVKTMPDV